jgi:antitoxin component YwqK of YwqJK toxin-antitoxin module
MAFIAVNAQNLITTNWPNGNKQTEGAVTGDAKISNADSKEEQARKMAAVVKDGKWTTWFENGTVRSEEYYSNGTMTGTWKSVYDNGQTEFTIDFASGKAVFYTKSGVVSSEGLIANGMVHKGDWTGYYENGTKNYKGSYDNEGRKDGVWTWWDEKGNMTNGQTFKNGTLLSTKSK